MNLPNFLTMSRCVLAVFIVGLLLANTYASIVAATVLFVVASLTDFYDGYLAKKQGLITDFGKIMDPIADKVLMLLVFGALYFLGLMDAWMWVIIALREIVVTFSRLHAIQHGLVIPAEKAGKIKTVCQILTIMVALLFLICEQSDFAATWFYRFEMPWRTSIQVLMLASVALTVVSGASYFKTKVALSGKDR